MVTWYGMTRRLAGMAPPEFESNARRPARLPAEPMEILEAGAEFELASTRDCTLAVAVTCGALVRALPPPEAWLPPPAELACPPLPPTWPPPPPA